MWLGAERKELKPGTSIVIPKGTAHGGTIVAQGPVKAVAIKMPPPPPTDTVFIRARRESGARRLALAER
jgi:mannose-6-phosphate isomerase-like protein (cupin superfamily)